VSRSLSEKWDQCKEELRQALDPDDALAWLPGLRLAHLSRERAVLEGIPNAFFHQRILRHYAPLLRRTLAGVFRDWGLAEDLELELRTGREGQTGAQAEPDPGAEGSGRSKSAAWPGLKNGAAPSFDTFQVGAANRAACALAREVAAAPGRRYNPFFLTGGAGQGKSHLLGAIAREAAARHPGSRIVQRTAEQFTVEVLDGIRRKRMHAVRELYRGADMLLLDALDFLEVSAKAQEELLHTFEALYEGGKQMVFTAQRAPTALQGLQESLRSRLEGSLVAEVGPPDRETRLAILRAAAARAAIPLAEPELAFLAERITGSPRRLEGALVRIAAYASLLGEPVDGSFVRELAAPWLDPLPAEQGHAPPPAVLELVCKQFALTPRQLRGRDRSRQRDLARQMAMRLLREASGLAYGEIGRLLGNRAHSTVIAAIAALERKLAAEPSLAGTWSRMQSRLAQVSQPGR
jgi:chromosomal replication initiator protein